MVQHVGQDIFDASLAHLVASGAYSTPEQLQSASMAHIAAAQAAAMHRQAQLGAPGQAPPHLDPAILSSLHAQQQHFFGLQHDAQSRAMLMQQQQQQHLALFGAQPPDAKGADVKPMLPPTSDGTGSVPVPPVTHSEMAAAAAAARAGHFLPGQMTLHQQMQFMPFYGAMHPGFVVPPPGMAIPAPELPPPVLPDSALAGAVPHGLVPAVPQSEAAAEVAPPLAAPDANTSGVPPPGISADLQHVPPPPRPTDGDVGGNAPGAAMHENASPAATELQAVRGDAASTGMEDNADATGAVLLEGAQAGAHDAENAKVPEAALDTLLPPPMGEGQ